MKIKPSSDRVLVIRIEEKGKITGGIIITDKSGKIQQEGKITAVGSEKWDENGIPMFMEVKKRDHVVFGKYAGNEVKIDVVEYLFTIEDDILGLMGK